MQAYTIREAQALFDTYGTITIVDGDDRSVMIYDDDADFIADNYIDCLGI